MKAVIVELKRGKAAAMTDDGRFVKIPNNGYQIGQKISLYEKETKKETHRGEFRKNLVAAAVAVMMTLSAGSGAVAFALPYGTVSVDVNPSVEYTFNCYDRVIKVSGVNEDGEALLSEIDKSELMHKQIADAVSATIEHLDERGYLQDEDSCIVISTSSKDNWYSENLANKLHRDMPHGEDVYSVAVSREYTREAHENGMTAGRMKIVEGIRDIKPEDESVPFDIGEWRDKPVDELMTEMRERGGQPESMFDYAPDPMSRSERDIESYYINEAFVFERPASNQTQNTPGAVENAPAEQIIPEAQEPVQSNVEPREGSTSSVEKAPAQQEPDGTVFTEGPVENSAPDPSVSFDNSSQASFGNEAPRWQDGPESGMPGQPNGQRDGGFGNNEPKPAF